MNEKVLSLLEFDKVVGIVLSHAQTAIGKELIASLKPSSCFEEVMRRLTETTAVRRWFERHGAPPIGAVRDVRGEIERARHGAVLEPWELLAIAGTLSAALDVKAELKRHGELPEPLASLSEEISDLKWLVQHIRMCIDERGNVVDDASGRLRQVRNRLRSLRETILGKLHALLVEPGIQHAIQEPIITIRGGRYCIPIKASHRHAVKGVVHDKSSSGLTLFVEPESIVELGNEFRELQLDEEREVQRILRGLTDDVVKSLPEIERVMRSIARIDMLFALAEFSRAMKCVEPEVHPDGATVLLGARHPLLGEAAVPIDVRVGGDFNALIITGPNMGGKTVTLKTIGLLTLMAQAGMHIPAKEGSRIRVFQKVFADIGEEQSIELSLSSFSSHMLNIATMLEHADNKALILIDELGAGTDPEEGAALSKAILKRLCEMGAVVVCTTHLGEVKAFAQGHPNFMNASMQFDPQTLQPTYKLVMGSPGASYALIIARRLGMPTEVIEDAERMRKSSFAEWERALKEVDRQRNELERQLAAIEMERQSLRSLIERYEDELQKLSEERERLLRQAREEALGIIKRASDEVESILREMRKQTSESVVTEKLRKRLTELKREFASEVKGAAQASYVPRVGESVFVPRIRVHGTVVETRESSGQVLIEVDGLRFWMPLGEVQAAHVKREGASEPPTAALRIRKMLSVPNELNIIGRTVEEALQIVDKFLDDAFLAGHRAVRIIHGKGKLRQAVHGLLKKHAHVESFELAPLNEGGTGATIVKLKVV
ncbi:MAG: endonuclease MutS2 [Armatimonadota bacterium]|nr:endonuclease MutS2 [Armatimonadota bacterium]MCX7776527.1 endonuclease MutS2 [Armatimonadota bacterium]MDW8024326.1 endonuclease MutS2 [Armatimonadota bacterium]